jgi:hypothetical protein
MRWEFKQNNSYESRRAEGMKEENFKEFFQIKF